MAAAATSRVGKRVPWGAHEMAEVGVDLRLAMKRSSSFGIRKLAFCQEVR